jgi:U3 small nucleolar RNA-associated protein 23
VSASHGQEGREEVFHRYSGPSLSFGLSSFIATYLQDPQLTRVVRSLPGVPLLYISHKAINLEKPSQSSKDVSSTTTPEDVELEQVRTLKKQILGAEETPVVKRKRKKAKGPNPLSCKKKKKLKAPQPNAATTSESKKKRSRKRRKRSANEVAASD